MRQDGVHRVTHLVRRREDVVQGVGVVEEHVRVNSVHRRRVRTGPLAFVLVDVDPAAGEALPHQCLVGGSERRDRVDDPVEHFLVVVFLVDGHERNGEVVDVVRGNLQHPPAELVIAPQRRHAGPGRLDQVLDDRGRDVVAVQRGFERALVAARPRLEPVPLADRVVERGIGVQRRFVGLVQRRERLLAVRLLVARRENGAVLAVGDGDLFPVRQRDLGELRVRGRERPVGVVRRRGEPAGERHEPLARLVEHVLLLPVQVLDREAVEAQLGALIHPLPHGLERNLEQLRAEPRLRLLPPRKEDLHLLPPRVDRVVALVLVVLKRWVVPHAVRELAELFGEPKRLQQRLGSLRERALQRRVSIDARFELLVRGIPRLPALEDVPDVPLEMLGDFGAVATARRRRCGGQCFCGHPITIARPGLYSSSSAAPAAKSACHSCAPSKVRVSTEAPRATS